jgi:hypothetical protein
MAKYPDDLNRGPSRHDREYFSYTDCEGKIAKRVHICQRPGETIKVEIEEESGLYLVEYAEINSVAGLASVDIIDYTVPVGKELKLKTVEASGENKAVYSVKINDTIKSKKRSYFTEYNVDFDAFNLILNAGDNIKVTVDNTRNSVADFNANFIGVIQDA